LIEFNKNTLKKMTIACTKNPFSIEHTSIVSQLHQRNCAFVELGQLLDDRPDVLDETDDLVFESLLALVLHLDDWLPFVAGSHGIWIVVKEQKLTPEC
jgi:hypothetical protein